MSKLKHFPTSVLIIVLLLLGSLSTWLTWNFTEKKLTNNALSHARLIAQSININRLQNLRADESDLKSSDYHRIREQLTKIRKAHSTCRFLYLIGQKKDGTVFFFLDSQPIESEDYAPPGLVYDEVSKEYINVFETGKADTVGPVTDRWGTLISSLVPIYSPKTNKVIAVLGMDTDAMDWNRKILLQCLLPIGLTIFIVILVVFFIIFGKTQQSLGQCKTASIFMVAVFLFGLFLTWYTWEYTTRRLKENTLEQARLVARAINTKRLLNLQGNLTDLKSLDYLRIKEQLTQIRQSHTTCRFLYLMGRREDNTVFFFLDSQSQSSKDYAPPGLIYEEVSEAYIKSFDSGKQRTVGPITDRWGTLITSLIPIYAFDTNKLIAVLGMDIDTKDWEKIIILQCFLPLGLTIFIMFLIISLFIINHNRQTIKQQNKEIQKKHAESNHLLHILCHDLANPIGNIKLLLQLVKENPNMLDNLLNTAIIANSNACDIIELVRKLRTLEEKKAILPLKHYHLNDLLEESYSLLENNFKNKNIILEKFIPEGLLVKVEKTSFINSVINNLLSNAIKFSYPDTKIIFSAEMSDDIVKLTIKDQGIGMPKALLENIFDVSKKTSRPGTDGELGTGYGMPLVKKFIQEYHGEIKIQSIVKSSTTKNHGTEVTLHLQP